MAVKRASLRGKGASIFFGDEDEQQTAELANSETSQPVVHESEQLSEFDISSVANNQTAEVVNSPTQHLHTYPNEFPSDSVTDLQSNTVPDYASSDDADFDTNMAGSSTHYTLPSSTVTNSRTSQADNSATHMGKRNQAPSSRLTNAGTLQDDNQHSNITPRLANSATSQIANSRPEQQMRNQYTRPTSRLGNSGTSQIANSNNAAASRRPEQAISTLANSGTSQADNFAAAPPHRDIRAARDLQSSPVGNSRTPRVANYNVRDETMIADETRAEYLVEYTENDPSQPLQRPTFSEFYTSGETHYLMLEPLATRITTEQMDHLSALERRIHQGRRRKEPRVTKNSIIRALLEATFDLDLDTRDINSETELVNRFREALHLADVGGELRGR